eukprot:4858083-Pleurochrysis_carterae.AAC.1
MHPGGRPNPHTPHVFKQAAKFAQGRRVCTVREGALDSLHRSEGLVARGEKHSRPCHEDDSQPEDG